jgi:tRNA-specific 2-thiouridylase
MTARNMNWLVCPPGKPFSCDVRVRHSRTVYPAVAEPDGDGVNITFDAPVRAPTPGQFAVLYDGDRLLGGGSIV